jgi:hypothetical protein
MFQSEFSMSGFAIGEQVEKIAGDREPGTAVAVFLAVDDSLEYAAAANGFGACPLFTEKKPAFTLTRRTAA